MARKPRLHVPGGLYHVILRGNARQDIFFTPGDRQRFYELLAESSTRLAGESYMPTELKIKSIKMLGLGSRRNSLVRHG